MRPRTLLATVVVLVVLGALALYALISEAWKRHRLGKAYEGPLGAREDYE
jgi:hypothetical protein